MGHGWGPFGIPKGSAQKEFRELSTTSSPSPDIETAPLFNLLPGVYYLVTVWSPLVLDTSDAAKNKMLMGAGQLRGVYATARSLPVRIEIMPRE